MREMEFLPQSYVRLRQRRRMALLQVWATLTLTCGAVSWLGLAQRNVHAVETCGKVLETQLGQTNAQLQQMDRLETLRRQWRQKADVLEKLGLHVEAGRLFNKLAEVLPEHMALLSFSFDIDESACSLTGAARAALKDPAKPPMDRRLRVRIQGVSPTDVELATFITELNKIHFIEHVAPSYVRDRRQAAHVLREFELSFTINLTPGA